MLARRTATAVLNLVAVAAVAAGGQMMTVAPGASTVIGPAGLGAALGLFLIGIGFAILAICIGEPEPPSVAAELLRIQRDGEIVEFEGNPESVRHIVDRALERPVASAAAGSVPVDAGPPRGSDEGAHATAPRPAPGRRPRARAPTTPHTRHGRAREAPRPLSRAARGALTTDG